VVGYEWLDNFEHVQNISTNLWYTQFIIIINIYYYNVIWSYFTHRKLGFSLVLFVVCICKVHLNEKYLYENGPIIVFLPIRNRS
jgi:hypothetical protein